MLGYVLASGSQPPAAEMILEKSVDAVDRSTRRRAGDDNVFSLGTNLVLVRREIIGQAIQPQLFQSRVVRPYDNLVSSGVGEIIEINRP